MRVRFSGRLLEALVWWQRDGKDATTPRVLHPDWALRFMRLVVIALTVELALATCTQGRVG